MAKQKRRSAEEWSRHVAAWRRSGETAARYAERKGLSVGSLRWWSWRLGRDHGRDEAVELVAVEVVPDPAPRSVDGEQWRLTTRGGDELCGTGAMAPELAKALVTAVMGERS